MKSRRWLIAMIAVASVASVAILVGAVVGDGGVALFLPLTLVPLIRGIQIAFVKKPEVRPGSMMLLPMDAGAASTATGDSSPPGDGSC